MKLAFADVGELGWGLYLSAHCKYLKNKHGSNVSICIFTTKDRFCLYENTADILNTLPKDYKEKYSGFSQDGFGLYSVGSHLLKNYFTSHLPTGYTIPKYFNFRCYKIPIDQMIFTPYKYSDNNVLCSKKRILIFPRYRKFKHHATRNLSKQFYVDVIKQLCLDNPNITITTIGTINGAYTFEDISIPNFEDLVGKTNSLQDMFDICQNSVLAIGGTSAPPKMTLLQKVPTIIIGHERARFTEEENWSKTDVLFYDIKLEEYQTFDGKDFICQAQEFLRKVLIKN